MTLRTTVLPLGFGLSAVLCFGTRGDAQQTKAEKPRPARVYTNEDLDRVHPFRHETGVSSVPAEAPADAPAKASPGGSARSGARRGEEYWRAQAARVRDRVRRLEARAAQIRVRIAEREQDDRRRLPRLGASDGAASIARLEARLDDILEQIRHLEEDLQDRARRAGALPGWLR
jgi:hypothetical protein